MKICLFGESPDMKTGFGQQLKLLASSLEDLGHEVCYGVAGPVEERPDLVHVDYNNATDVDKALRHHEPDLAIMFIFVQCALNWLDSRYLGSKVPCVVWPAWEMGFVDPVTKRLMDLMPAKNVWNLSSYAKKLWGKGKVIYHGVPDTFVPTDDKADVRRQLSRKLSKFIADDSLLMLNVDRNDERKNWVATLDVVSQLRDKVDRRVQLIAHTSSEDPRGVNLPSLIEQFGIEDCVILTGSDGPKNKSTVDDETYLQMFQASDYRISTTLGEGFGVPAIEAMATGCINVAPDNTCIKEIVGYANVVDCDSKVLSRNVLWDSVSVPKMVDKIIEFEKDSKLSKKVVLTGLDNVSNDFSQKSFQESVRCALEDFEPSDSSEYPLGYMTARKYYAILDVVHGLSRANENVPVSICGTPKFKKLANGKAHFVSDNVHDAQVSPITCFVDCLMSLSPEDQKSLATRCLSAKIVAFRTHDIEDHKDSTISSFVTSLLANGFGQMNDSILDSVVGKNRHGLQIYTR